jgi:uncharacterized protein involved in response to NO
MTVLVQPHEPSRAGAPARFALFALGFRPFYLLASVFAAVSVGLWGLQSTGLLGAGYLAGAQWHAHEMLFGFTLAVVVGFLFTAGRNWTGRATPTGGRLAALAALWVAGRVLVLTPFPLAAAVANVAFPLAAAVALAIPFYTAGSRRNYFFVGLMLLMAVATGIVHLHALGWIQLPAWAGLALGLDVMLFILAVMGGRVIPMFTNNGVLGAKAKRNSAVEQVALGSLLGLPVSALLPLPGLVAIVAVVAAAAHTVRWWLWQPWKTLRVPLVWVLHLAYAWIPVHLLLRAMALGGAIAPSASVHALTVGAIGGLVIGMMTRTARGHTGRLLQADRWDTTCYVLVAAAAFVRVLLPLFVPAWTLHALLVSSALWSAGFGLYAVCYWPVLSRSRIDGQPG